jgi:hypothetical protein
MDLDRHAESDLVLAVFCCLAHDPVEGLSHPRVGDFLFRTDTDKGHPVGDVEWTLARNHLTLLTARAESLGFCPQRFAFLGRELEPAQRITFGALENINAIEGFLRYRTELMKICHLVRFFLL